MERNVVLVLLALAGCLGGPDEVEVRDEAIRDLQSGFHDYLGSHPQPADRLGLALAQEAPCDPVTCDCPRPPPGCAESGCGCDWDASGTECNGTCVYECEP